MDETSEIDGLPFRGVLEDLPLDLLIGWSASLLIYVSKHSCHPSVHSSQTCQLPFWIDALEIHCQVHYNGTYSAATRAQDLESLPQALCWFVESVAFVHRTHAATSTRGSMLL